MSASAVEKRLGKALEDAKWNYTDVMHLDEYLLEEYPDEEIIQYVKHFATSHGYTASVDSQEASERTFPRRQNSVRAAVANHASPRTETRDDHGESNPGDDLIDDPDGYAQYDPNVRYLTRPRDRIGDADLVRGSLPPNGTI